MLNKIKVSLTVFKAKLAYAGKTWRDNRKNHVKAFGICAYIVQVTEILTLLCLFAAIQLLVISWWSLL